MGGGGELVDDPIWTRVQQSPHVSKILSTHITTVHASAVERDMKYFVQTCEELL